MSWLPWLLSRNGLSRGGKLNRLENIYQCIMRCCTVVDRACCLTATSLVGYLLAFVFVSSSVPLLGILIEHA